MEKLQYVLLAIIPLLFSLSFHEAAHAWTANRLGDPTARMMGRITLNPLPHIDPLGTIFLPLLFYFLGGSVFGWAKPVPVNERNFRNPRMDGLKVAAAGPLSNLLLAVGFTILLIVLTQIQKRGLDIGTQAGMTFLQPLNIMAAIGVQLNVLLAIFNLVPLPPLDGSRVFLGFFPGASQHFYVLERYGFILLVILLYTGILDTVVFRPTALLSHYLLSWVH